MGNNDINHLHGVKLLEVCFPEDLDFHPGDNECLVGVRVTRTGRDCEGSARLFLRQVNQGDWGIPGDLSDTELRAAFLKCIDGWGMSDHTAPVGRGQRFLSAWFSVKWGDCPKEEVDEEAEYDEEAEQQAFSRELCEGASSFHDFEWGDRDPLDEDNWKARR